MGTRRTTSIVAEKVDQAIGLLKEHKIDAWMTFVRETTETGDRTGVILWTAFYLPLEPGALVAAA